MTITGDPGIYIIHCNVSDASYVGAAKTARSRVQSHLSSLARGENGCELLQEDWNRYGPDAFDIRFLHVALDDLYWLEKIAIRHINSLEEHGGYNKALGRLRTLAARIRDTECKLIRSGKFELLSPSRPYARINSTLARSFYQKSRRLSDETKEIEEAVAFDPDMAEKWLAGFEVVTPAQLARAKRQRLH